MSKKKNLLGATFSRLTVIKDTGKLSDGRPVWLCYCICGNFTEVITRSLTTNHTKSCGCLRKGVRYKHGGRHTRLYQTWINMKGRCYNPNKKTYRRYGQRGIKICDKWRNNFTIFKDWALRNGYKSNLTIDRIDNDKGYYPSNCQWLTLSENARKSNA